MKETTERHILTHSDVCGHSVLCFYTIEHVVLQVTQQITSHTLTVNITVTFLLVAEYQKKTTTVHVLTGTLYFYSIKIYFIEIFFTKSLCLIVILLQMSDVFHMQSPYTTHETFGTIA